MSNENENALVPAFPTSEPCAFPKYSPGLTKREYFAAMAMQGIVSRPTSFESHDDIADMAIKTADALLAQLSK